MLVGKFLYVTLTKIRHGIPNRIGMVSGQELNSLRPQGIVLKLFL